MSQYLYLIIALLIVSFCVSCGYFNEEANEDSEPIARVYDKYLYHKDLAGLVREDMDEQDSMKMVNGYIDSWIRKSIILKKAERFLPEEKMNIDRQVNDYKESLLVHTYEQEWIRSKMDTVVTDAQIADYYEEFKNNFRLKDDLVYGTYIILKNGAPQIGELTDNLEEEGFYSDFVQDYCYQFATAFSLEPNWYLWSEFRSKIPLIEKSSAAYQQLFTDNNEDKTYFASIEKKIAEGNIAPIDYVRPDISKILINKRKVQLVKNVNTQAYEEAAALNEIEIFKGD